MHIFHFQYPQDKQKTGQRYTEIVTGFNRSALGWLRYTIPYMSKFIYSMGQRIRTPTYLRVYFFPPKGQTSVSVRTYRLAGCISYRGKCPPEATFHTRVPTPTVFGPFAVSSAYQLFSLT